MEAHATPQAYSQLRVLMNRTPLPLVRGVYGLVRLGVRR